MGKVKGDEKFSNEIASRKKKKRKKELDLLRKKVLETKRKLREKIAPQKAPASTFTKILNKFADLRQTNDNKTQGFDNKGRRTEQKKMCTRLLPSRKPQVGIFANGSKGAEIKREDLPLSHSARARFEGDLQKILCNGKKKSKEFKFDGLKKILQKQSTEIIEMEERVTTQSSEEILETKLIESFRQVEKQSDKRKMQVPVESDEKINKKSPSKIINAQDMIKNGKNKLDKKCAREKTWKRSLFKDEDDDFDPIHETNVDELRFSPKIDKVKVELHSPEPKVSPNLAQPRPGEEKLNFNYEQLGKMAATRYRELCAIVCAKNFDTCLKDIPHVDPLKNVKKSLTDFYLSQQKLLQNKYRPKMSFIEESSLTNSRNLVHANIKNSKYFDESTCLQKLRLSPIDTSKLQNTDQGYRNLKNSFHQKARNPSSLESESMNTSDSNIKKRENIPLKNPSDVCGVPLYSEKMNELPVINSLEVNYDSSRPSLKSDIAEILVTNDGTALNLNKSSDSVLAGIPTNRKKIMIRFLREVQNDQESVKEGRRVSPEEVSAVLPKKNDEVRDRYLGDNPTRQPQMRGRKSENVLGQKSDEKTRVSPPPPPSTDADIFKPTPNSLDVNCDSGRSCSGLNLRESLKIKEIARPAFVNLGSASSSTLVRIPSSKEKILLRYLQDVNNHERRKVFAVFAESDNHVQKNYLADRLKKHRSKNINLTNFPTKNEKHVPAILRKCRTSKNNIIKMAGTAALAKGILDVEQKKNCPESLNLNFENPFSQNNTTTDSSLNKSQNSKKSENSSPFFVNPTYSECLNDMKKKSNQIQLELETPKVTDALYNWNELFSRTRSNFLNMKTTENPSEFSIEKKDTTSSPRVMNLFEKYEKSPCIHQLKKLAKDKQPLNFHNDNFRIVPIISDRQQPEAAVRKFSPKHPDQNFQRFPVYLKRKNSNCAYRENQRHRQPPSHFPENGEAKVIIIENPRHEVAPCKIFANDSKSMETTFFEYPGNVEMANSFQNNRLQVQRFEAPKNVTRQNIDRRRQSEMQIPQYVYKNEQLEDIQRGQLPRVIYRNGIPAEVNRNESSKVTNDGKISTSFRQSTNFEIQPNCQKIFHQVPPTSSNAEIPFCWNSSYRGNSNLDIQRNYEANQMKFNDRRFGFVIPKNKTEFGNRIVPPGQKFNIILSDDKNCNYEYIIDPRCPQVGHKRSQIDESGAGDHHQCVIEPMYNVTDAYRPQASHNYFSTGC